MAVEIHANPLPPMAGTHSAPSLAPPIRAPDENMHVAKVLHPPGGGGSGRPPRKSTLTQQQKNNKRQRATQDQLATLELEFNKNPTPTAPVRDKIAEEINMTVRSVQIWFQNRRAKIKLMAKKGLETGEGMDQIPESMRNYLAVQAMESGKGLGNSFLGRQGLPYGGAPSIFAEPNGKLYIQHFTCRSLSIGKWMRVGQTAMDLVVFYTIDKRTVTYYINNDQAGYKIEFPFHYIKNAYLESRDGDSLDSGAIVFELTHPPHFFMDSMGGTGGGFTEVGDFTEDQQASHCLVHHLGGNPKVLNGQLSKLISLDVFANRHQATTPMTPLTPFDQPVHAQVPLSAPVSPTNRPSSQPNFAQPHLGLLQENQWGLTVPPGMRGMAGHKRQRSRSVPTAVDFSLLQAPMPSFFIQHPGEPVVSQPPHASLYSPAPQHSGLAPINPSLRIDTQAGCGLDMRQHPLSAATSASPSEYSTPNYMAQTKDAPLGTPLGTPAYTHSYGQSFLSPMMNPQNLAPPLSPLSFAPGDPPAAAEQSPPGPVAGRPSSADAISTGVAESCTISDDGSALNELCSNPAISVPRHSPNSPCFLEPAASDLDLSSLVQFDPMDPSGIPPEAIPRV